MSTNNFTCKIPVADRSSTCIINSEWLSSEIKFLLLHDNQAWKGEFQLTENEDITELLDQLSLSRVTYLEESKKALTTHYGADNFTYTLEDEIFTWKKKVRKNMSVKFGSVNLFKVALYEGFEKVLDNTLQSNSTLFTKLQDSDKQKDVLEKENNILKSKLNEVVVKKNEMEETLYGQFLHLLNEKKRRIKELKNQMPVEDYQDIIQSDEGDHFNSDTEIDSEEEKKLSISKSSLESSNLHKNDEPVTLPKKSRQKRPNESIAGPSGENTKVKNSKIVYPKNQAVNRRKGQRKSVKESCVISQQAEEKDKNESEASEDVFLFLKRSKINVKEAKAVKPKTSKVKYESDEKTDSDIEQPATDTDETPSQIDQAKSPNENMNLELVEKNETMHSNFKQEIDGKHEDSFMISDELKEVCEDSKVSKKPCYKGLSSSTLDILNQLV